MTLKYVGALPVVSGRGVSFDQTKPDRYTFLNAAVELLEALSTQSTEDRKITLVNIGGKEYSGRKLVELLEKHCTDMETVFASREKETNELIEKYIDQVKANDKISGDERSAWLGNVAAMRDYYLQYITNENAYKCALRALADKIHQSHIDEIIFPLGRNYGLVLNHLVQVLTDYRPPYDATLSVVEKNGETFGKLDMNRSKPLSV